MKTCKGIQRILVQLGTVTEKVRGFCTLDNIAFDFADENVFTSGSLLQTERVAADKSLVNGVLGKQDIGRGSDHTAGTPADDAAVDMYFQVPVGNDEGCRDR